MRTAWMTWVSLSAALATSGCGESTAPVTAGVVLTPITAQQQVAALREDASQVPTVRVSSLTDGSPIPGLKVTFTQYTPDGNSTTRVATSDKNGVARLASWRMEALPGFYRVDAIADNAVPVAFRAYVPGSVLERFYSTPDDDHAVLVTEVGGGYFWGENTSGYPAGNYSRSELGAYALYIDPLAEDARFYLASQYLVWDGAPKGDTLILNRPSSINQDGGFGPLILFKRTRQIVSPVNEDQIVESYELQTIGGHSLPVTYTGGGSAWQVSGARYDLLADGTFYFYYIGVPWEQQSRSHPNGYYSRTASSIEFYSTGPLSPFYAERNGHFSTGVLSGTTMTVHYEDPVDFDEEVYTRRK